MILALTYDTDVAGLIFVVAAALFFVAAVIFGKLALPNALVAGALGLCAVVWVWQQFAAG